MKINKDLEPVIKLAVEESLKNYEFANEGGFLGDLGIYYDKEARTLALFDDMEKELHKVILEEFVKTSDIAEQEIEDTVKAVLKELEKENSFNKSFIYKPFTVNLIDDDFSVIVELIFIDDETLKLDKDIWPDLDKELDEFLKELLK